MVKRLRKKAQGLKKGQVDVLKKVIQKKLPGLIHTVQLNGKHYDALTGAYIGNAAKDTVHQRSHDLKSTVNTTPAHHSPRHAPSLSGSGMLGSVVHQPVAVQKMPLQPIASRSDHHAPTHQSAHKPQHAKTLMRHAVRAPQTFRQPAIKSQAAIAHKPIKVAAAIQPKPTVISVNPHRSQRSQAVDRSPMVNKFNTFNKSGNHFQTSDIIPSKPAVVALPHFTQPIQKLPNGSSKKSTMRSLQDMRRPPARPRQTLAAPANPKPTTSIHPAASHRSDARHEHDIFEQALAMATSHEQSPPKQSILKASLAAKRKRRIRRTLSIATSAAVFLGLCGFIAYQNKTNIQLQLASAKAGFMVSDPAYKPDGFAMDKVTYSPGNASSWYSNAGSNSNGTAGKDKTFSVIQKKSNWDSQTLLENFVATSNESYQGYQANGRTVYVYGTGRATWVNGGIWYQIQAGDILSSEQLVKVAASM